MKVCVDTNVLISYLLAPGSIQPPSRIVAAAFASSYSLIIAEPTIVELVDKVQLKPYLANRIPRSRLDAFLEALARVASIVSVPEVLPRIVRDDRDDYLLAPAIIEQVDYVVSGDKDLLVLNAIAGVRIVSPAAFVAILNDAPASPTMGER